MGSYKWLHFPHSPFSRSIRQETSHLLPGRLTWNPRAPGRGKPSEPNHHFQVLCQSSGVYFEFFWNRSKKNWNHLLTPFITVFLGSYHWLHGEGIWMDNLPTLQRYKVGSYISHSQKNSETLHRHFAIFGQWNTAVEEMENIYVDDFSYRNIPKMTCIYCIYEKIYLKSTQTCFCLTTKNGHPYLAPFSENKTKHNKIPKRHQPGDSSRDFFIPDRWRSLNPLKGSRFNHHKELPGKAPWFRWNPSYQTSVKIDLLAERVGWGHRWESPYQL